MNWRTKLKTHSLNSNSLLRIIFFIFIFIFIQSCSYKASNTSLSYLDSLSLKIDKDSLNPNFLYERALIYLDNRQLSLAKKDIESAYRLFKNDVDILLTRGQIFYELNETRLSKESWERCLLIDPNNISCRYNLTSLLCAVNDFRCKSMIDTLSLLTNQILPIDLIAHLKELKYYKDCVVFLANLLNIDSLNIDALHLRSMIYSDTASHNQFFNLDLAESYFLDLINRFPFDSQVYYNYAKLKQDVFNYSEALNLYKKIVHVDSLNRQVYYNMGFCAMQLNNYSESVDYFSQAILIDNSFLLAYHARAYVYELNNEFSKSKSDWKYCLMLSPSYIPALEGLSRLK